MTKEIRMTNVEFGTAPFPIDHTEDSAHWGFGICHSFDSGPFLIPKQGRHSSLTSVIDV
jgi:hypothetical protein